MPGLYAAGETAAVSINGANRLGSNSLTECLVFGRRSGVAATRFANDSSEGNESVLIEQAKSEAGRMDALRNKTGGEKISQIRREMNQAMETGCGVFRDQASMDATIETIVQLKGRYADIGLSDRSKIFNTEITMAMELRNMLDVAEAVAFTAAKRTESRGAHTRTDFTTRNDADFLKHSMLSFTAQGPQLEYKDVTLTRWEPEERKY
jgi:fumarate reductase flavoprotein subunit